MLLLQHFDNAAVLGPDVDTVGFEIVEIGAGGGTLGSGVPPVVVGDVAAVVDAVTVAVVDGELVIFETVVFCQSADDETVVHAVAIGGDEVGIGEIGVAMVAVPEDIERRGWCRSGRRSKI